MNLVLMYYQIAVSTLLDETQYGNDCEARIVSGGKEYNSCISDLKIKNYKNLNYLIVKVS